MVTAVGTKPDVRPTFAMSRPDNLLSNLFNIIGFQRVADIEDADVVVFGGGADINPFLYGHMRHPTTYVDYNTDMMDLINLKKCGDYQSKVGICRGGQFLNCMVGNGTLYQHVTDHAVSGGHRMTLVSDAHKEFAKEVQVTSTHHQMMVPGPGAELIYCANIALEKHTANSSTKYTSANRTNIFDDTEVVLYPDRVTLCYQPHPEYIQGDNYDNKEVFIGLLNEHLIEDKFHENIWTRFYNAYS